MNSIQAVAFDCDGVMFDTVKANTAYYNHILNHFNKPELTSEQFDFVHMHTAEDSINHLFDGDNLLPDAHNYRNTMKYFSFIKDMEIEPHLKPLLSRLRPRYKTAVATNRTDTMKHVLEEHGLDGYFDLVVTAGDVEFPKPNPELLVKILDYFRITSPNLLYIGDSKLDELAAKAAGVCFVAYNNPSIEADFYITSLKEIDSILH